MRERKTKIVLVAGARPNFMKIAPIIRELQKHEDCFEWSLVHTGQHYDHGMSEVFFKELGIPEPHFHMGAGGGGHAAQTARIMIAFEDYCLQTRPDIVCVVGDVDSTLACAIVAKKCKCSVVHVEAGLRSCDRQMPEEINRLVTDAISDVFFVTEQSGVDNLLNEGHRPDAVHFVGHVMIDNLFFQLTKLSELDPESFATQSLKRSLKRYGVVTLHRPSNVDEGETLSRICQAIGVIANELPLIFPVHPRTRRNIEMFHVDISPRIHLIEPLPYMEFLNLWKDASVVLTDSGGLQEETTALGVPCLTLRENTERPVTVTNGTNVLVGTDTLSIVKAARKIIRSEFDAPSAVPKLWDGKAAERIVAILRDQES